MPLRPPLRFAAQTDFAARSDFAFTVETYAFEEVEAPRCGCPACMGAPDDGREQIIFNGGETAFNGKPILSWDEAAAAITRGGYTWSPVLGQGVTVSYAFRADAPETMPNGVGGFVRFTAAQIAAAEIALQLWADVANITFVRVGSGTTGEGAYSNNATILFSNYTTEEENSAGFAYLPSPGATAFSSLAGDIWIDSTEPGATNPIFGEYAPHVLVHEIGHAIGLRHPSAYNGGSPTYAANADYFQDARPFTVMTYFGSSNVGGVLGLFSVGPQLHDIAAAQRLYGANMNTRTGDTTYGFNSNTGRAHSTISSSTQTAVFAIWDGGGFDTLDLSGYSQNAEIDLRPEALSSAGPTDSGPAKYNIAIARGVIIERGIGGSGNDLIIGNVANNELIGNNGNDTLDGGAGADTLNGGAGNDTYRVDNAGDVIIDSSGDDTVEASVTWTLGAGLERLTLIGGGAINGTGNDLANVMQGNSSANVFRGNGGNDTIVGGLGVDTSVYAGVSGGASWVRSPSGSWTVVSGADGSDTLSSVERLLFSDRSVILDMAQQTFSGDGTSDILWRRVDGVVATWGMLGVTQTDTRVLGGVSLDWSIAGSGDFNGDGRDDILWSNASGLVAFWEGGDPSFGRFVASVPTSWQIAGIGDFNFDGRDDFLWRSDAGAVAVWTMNGAVVQGQALIGSAGLEWDIVGVADFNGDGSDDILWRRDDGAIAQWSTNGSGLTGATFVASVAPSWNVVGTGDFDGDGRADILWRNSDGSLAVWAMDGATLRASSFLGGVGAEWSVADVGDYNGDGRDDILWRSDAGLLAVWTMGGALTVAAKDVWGQVGTDWIIA